MKNKLGITLLGLGLLTCGGVGLGLSVAQTVPSTNEIVMVRAEEEPPAPVYECSVSITNPEHAKITVDKNEGHVGDVVTVTVKTDLFYLVENVSVNGTALIESETTKGEYTFALVEGANTITSSIVIDQELLGSLSEIVEQASNKDWTNLFSVKNVVTIVAWILDGGLLIALVRYYIKDKKLAKAVEKQVQDTMTKLVPDQTKQSVIKATESIVTPLFTNLNAEMVELMKGMSVMAKCMALMQENTPEAKLAILDELSNLKIGDLNSIDAAKKYIEELVAKQQKTYEETMKALEEIKATNDAIAKEENSVEVVASDDDGTVI